MLLKICQIKICGEAFTKRNMQEKHCTLIDFLNTMLEITEYEECAAMHPKSD